MILRYDTEAAMSQFVWFYWTDSFLTILLSMLENYYSRLVEIYFLEI